MRETRLGVVEGPCTLFKLRWAGGPSSYLAQLSLTIVKPVTVI
jgi:hypothetical protein